VNIGQVKATTRNYQQRKHSSKQYKLVPLSLGL